MMRGLGKDAPERQRMHHLSSPVVVANGVHLTGMVGWPSAGALRVSGMANQKSAAPTRAMADRVRKAASYPTRAATTPARVVLTTPPKAWAVATAPCAALKRPVPRVRSATMTG